MYNLNITKEQAEVLIKALDLYSRIGIGQFEEILKHPTWRYKLISSDHQINRAAEIMIADLRQLITGERHGGPGITVSEEHNRIAYDMLQVIQHRLAWDENPEGGTQVNFHDPIQWADHGLAEIEKEEE